MGFKSEFKGLTSWKPLGHSRPVTGLFLLLPPLSSVQLLRRIQLYPAFTVCSFVRRFSEPILNSLYRKLKSNLMDLKIKTYLKVKATLNTIQYITIQYSTLQYNTIQYTALCYLKLLSRSSLLNTIQTRVMQRDTFCA